jgi:hypothetical protein
MNKNVILAIIIGIVFVYFWKQKEHKVDLDPARFHPAAFPFIR